MAKIQNDREFSYWLQGYFEIAGTHELTESQARQVAKAANNVVQPGSMSRFVLDTVLDKGLEHSGPAIAAELNDIFLHEIDPTIEGDQEQLRRVHRGRDGRSDGPVAMC